MGEGVRVCTCKDRMKCEVIGGRVELNYHCHVVLGSWDRPRQASLRRIYRGMLPVAFADLSYCCRGNESGSPRKRKSGQAVHFGSSAGSSNKHRTVQVPEQNRF